MAVGVGHESLNPLSPTVLSRLDPKFVEVYNKNVANTPNKPIDLDLLRKVYSRMYGYATASAPECAREYELQVPGWSKYPGSITIRVYEPHGQIPKAGWPIHFDFHGGGWGLGDLETESHICRHICVKAGVVVVDVDYRLVPEYPFPVGVRDCEEAFRLVVSNAAEFKINPAVVTIGGVSAGACIALIVNHLARDAGSSIKGVIVGTPTIADISQYATAADSPYPSVKEMEFAPLLNWARLKWFDTLKWDSLEKKDAAKRAEQEEDVGWFRDIMQAPNCEGLADLTVIMTAECDPLRDEGEAYGKKIEMKGNKVVMKRFLGVPHPFQHMDAALDQGREFIQDTVNYVKSCQ